MFSKSTAKRLRSRFPTARAVPGGRLHVGCGRTPLAGWINVDRQRFPGVDLRLDIRDGLPFRDLGFVFAEHFLEHLTIEEALLFLGDAREALAPGGRIRLSTPNLDWVWTTHDPRVGTDEERLQKALVANRAFYGWEHRFLWSEPLLEEALLACGFDEPSFHAYGESDSPELRGLERHSRDDDSPQLPHVLIVEAVRGEKRAERLEHFLGLLDRELLDHLRG